MRLRRVAHGDTRNGSIGLRAPEQQGMPVENEFAAGKVTRQAIRREAGSVSWPRLLTCRAVHLAEAAPKKPACDAPRDGSRRAPPQRLRRAEGLSS